MYRFLRITMIVVSLLIPFFAQAKTNVLFILDGSNSMWGQVEGEAKITSAQKVLSELLRELPSDTQVGLMAYGHREKKSCDDIEVLSSVNENSIDTLTKEIYALKPKGKTPIAGALKKSLDVLTNLESDINNVVLISDGIESCDGDPCSAAKALTDAGINARVHVVGFDVSEEERKQLNCIPEMGNGKYFSAKNASELKLAAAEVKEIAIAEPPAEPQSSMWLEDSFDGEELAEHWEVINPDLDSYIVENGELLAITSKAGGLQQETIKNVFRLNKDLPKGDWRASIKFKVDFQTGKEAAFFGLYEDKDNFIINQVWPVWDGNGGRWYLRVSTTKYLKGESTNTETNVWRSEKVKRETMNATLDAVQPIILQLEKQGRNYASAIKFEGIEEPEWIKLPDLKLLRQKGNLAFGLYKSTDKKQYGGEASLFVDELKVETIEMTE